MTVDCMRGAWLALFLAAGAAACGGAFSHSDMGNSSGGGSSLGGASTTAGKPSKAGASANAGTGGGGGTPGVGGSLSMGGGASCTGVDCAFPICADGQTPITLAGQCCPSCPTSLVGCDNVSCQGDTGCPAGYGFGQPPGACCAGCVPQPGGVMCPTVACPRNVCPLGYVNGVVVGGCCTECVPDAQFCNDDSECVLADRPQACCGCPAPISVRSYNDDPCWSDVHAPRKIPSSCYPQIKCDEVCGACSPPGLAACQNHRCVELPTR
jgi:hypothetical protein